MELYLGAFTGLIAATVAIIEFLKKKFSWVDGKEDLLALVLPVAIAASAKVFNCTADFVQGSWSSVLIGSFVAGLIAQYSHDKILNPVLKPLAEWVMRKFAK
ncbi:MAG: hypothetical protein QXU32_02015 [Nitrososphaerales archaeon]